MYLETIDHETLRSLSAIGVVRSAHVVGQPGGWGVRVTYEMTERLLAAGSGQQARIFNTLETVSSYLKALGIMRFEVDAARFEPGGATDDTVPGNAAGAEATKSLPDGTYDAWLRAEVEAAIDDPSPSLSHEQVTRHFAAKRDALRKRVHS